MKTDAKIAIGISTVLVAIAIFLFLWGLPFIFMYLGIIAGSEQNSYDRAKTIPYLKKAVNCSVFKWQKLYTLEDIIITLTINEDYDEAISYYEKYSSLNPDPNYLGTKATKSSMTRVFIKKGDFETALKLANETNNKHLKAEIYIKTDRLDEAKKTVEEIFATKTDSKIPYLYVAQIQLKEGHPASALTSIEKLLTVNPRHLDALRTKAEILKALGKTTEAAKLEQQVKIETEKRKR